MKNTLIAIVVIVVLVLGYVFFVHKSAAPVAPAPEPATTDTTQTPPTTSTTTATAPASGVTITYTDSGFSPKTVTIKQGQSVTWVNQSSEQMWVASNPHPSHTGYDGTSRTTHCAPGYTGAAPLDECSVGGAGATFTFAFNKVGTWGYHNHLDESMAATVIVTP